jgi:hypothetical protein
LRSLFAHFGAHRRLFGLLISDTNHAIDK